MNGHYTATIERTGRYTFTVSSASRPGVVHTQDVLHLTCTCEAGAKGIRCWHLARALLIEQGYRPLLTRRVQRNARPWSRPALS